MKGSKIILLICILAIAGSGAGCAGGESPERGQADLYFDFPGYFAGEIARLEDSGYRLEKTIFTDNQEETQILRTADWERELARFKEVDINKPSWRNSYRIDSAGRSLTYTAMDPDLRVQKIRITGERPGAIRSVHIQKETKNQLYNTREELLYYPDSAYTITHRQKILLLSKDDFKVSGRIMPGGEG